LHKEVSPYEAIRFLPKAKKEDLSYHNKSVSSKQSILDKEFANQTREKFEEQEAVIKL